MKEVVSKQSILDIIDELGYVNCKDGKDFECNSRVDKIRQAIVELPTLANTDNCYDTATVIHDIKQKAFVPRNLVGVTERKVIFEHDALEAVENGWIDD